MQFIDSALMSPTRLLLKYTIQNATRQRLEVSPYYQLSMMHDLCSGHHTHCIIHASFLVRTKIRDAVWRCTPKHTEEFHEEFHSLQLSITPAKLV